MSSFYSDLADCIKSKNIDNANKVVMEELGTTIPKNKKNFIEVLKTAGVNVKDNITDADLVDLFVKNAPINDDLLIGTSYFIADQNKTVGLDGEEEISDTGVKAAYKVMNGYFGCEQKSNWVGAIAKAGGSIADLGSKIVEGKNQKKYGAAIQMGKQQDARNQLKQSLLSQREQQSANIEKEKERSAKTMKILLYSGIGIIVIGGSIFAWYKLKKK